MAFVPVFVVGTPPKIFEKISNNSLCGSHFILILTFNQLFCISMFLRIRKGSRLFVTFEIHILSEHSEALELSAIFYFSIVLRQYSKSLSYKFVIIAQHRILCSLFIMTPLSCSRFLMIYVGR